MKKETIERFLKKEVRLVTHGYAVFGEIAEVNEDCIIFKSKKGISAISLDAIESIVLHGQGGI